MNRIFLKCFFTICDRHMKNEMSDNLSHVSDKLHFTAEEKTSR